MMAFNELPQAESYRRISSTMAVIGGVGSRMSDHRGARAAMTRRVRSFRPAKRANRIRGWRAFAAAIAFCASVAVKSLGEAFAQPFVGWFRLASRRPTSAGQTAIGDSPTE